MRKNGNLISARIPLETFGLDCGGAGKAESRGETPAGSGTRTGCRLGAA
jgi:hypothetical protein